MQGLVSNHFRPVIHTATHIRKMCTGTKTRSTPSAAFQNSKKKNYLLSLWLLIALMECYHSKDTCIPSSDTPSILYYACDFQILTHFLSLIRLIYFHCMIESMGRENIRDNHDVSKRIYYRL